MAERVGFEPTSPAKGCQFSRLVFSTAQPSLRRSFYEILLVGARFFKKEYVFHQEDAFGRKQMCFETYLVLGSISPKFKKALISLHFLLKFLSNIKLLCFKLSQKNMNKAPPKTLQFGDFHCEPNSKISITLQFLKKTLS